MVSGTWSLVLIRNQLENPKFSILRAMLCLLLCPQMRTSWTDGRLRLRELLEPSRLLCLMSSGLLFGIVRVTQVRSDTLQASFVQQRTAPRFNAYHSLLSIQKN